MLEPGDGDEQLVFLLLNLEQDLLCDERLAGHQNYCFQEQTDSRGIRLCSEGNSSLTFQVASVKVGSHCFNLSTGTGR